MKQITTILLILYLPTLSLGQVYKYNPLDTTYTFDYIASHILFKESEENLLLKLEIERDLYPKLSKYEELDQDVKSRELDMRLKIGNLDNLLFLERRKYETCVESSSISAAEIKRLNKEISKSNTRFTIEKVKKNVYKGTTVIGTVALILKLLNVY